jgi:exopolysaccharide biosynthesis polyprenyl glycosylphosphotransferase
MCSARGSMLIRGTSWVGDLPLINVADRPLKNWAAVIKLIEDKLLAALLLAIFGLPMLIIAILIKLDSRGPVFFVQDRYGYNNTVIRVIKFRTMHVDQSDASGAQQTVRGDPRVTRVGRFLRASSLDELPQLFNVLRGDMSLIGPRAHALKMKAAGVLYDQAVEEYFMRHRVRPGLTGWAQVHGLRGETDTLEKAKRRLEFDLWYIENWSLSLDLAIFFATVRTVLKRQNAY